MLKLLVGRLGTARPARAAIGWARATTRLARRKLEGPRAATRSREADIFVVFWKREQKIEIPSRDESKRAIGGAGELDQRWAGPGELGLVAIELGAVGASVRLVLILEVTDIGIE